MMLAKLKNRNERSGSRPLRLRNGSCWIGLITTFATGCSLRSVDYLGNGLGGMTAQFGGVGANSATQGPGGGNAMLLGSAGTALGTTEVAGMVGSVPGLAGTAGASPSGGTAGVGARTSFAGGMGNAAMAGRLVDAAGAGGGAGRPSNANAGLGGTAALGGTSSSMAGNPGTLALSGMPSGGVGNSVSRGGTSASSASGGRTSSSGGTTSPNGGSSAGQGAAGDFGNGPPSLALDKPASASSVQDSSKGSNLASNGNDSSLTTRWCASNETVPQWWQVDLQQIHQLTGTRVIWEFSGRIYGYYIEVSNDETTWLEVVNKRNNTSADQAQSDSFSAQARYVRVTITSVSTNPTTWASFNDFSVYGQ